MKFGFVAKHRGDLAGGNGCAGRSVSRRVVLCLTEAIAQPTQPQRRRRRGHTRRGDGTYIAGAQKFNTHEVPIIR